MFATRDDFLRLGLPAPALRPAARQVEGVDTTLDRLLLSSHGLVDGDILAFRAQGILPAPISKTETYEAVPIDLNLYQIKYRSKIGY